LKENEPSDAVVVVRVNLATENGYGLSYNATVPAAAVMT
jgi:hypothetical protein